MTTPQQRHVIDVSDVDRLLECAQTDRQRAFQSLVRRFISQILHGCTSTFCTTPTCLSCNKRLVNKPFRPPTRLTARALAFYLASQNDASHRLCPHDLNVDPDTLEIEGLDGQYAYREDGEEAASYSLLSHRHSHSAEPGGHVSVRRAIRDAADARRITNAIEHRHQSRKDPKSLGQNLYDSVTIIFAFSKHIPTPSAVLASLSSSSIQEHQNVRSPQSPFSNSVPLDEQPTSPDQRSFPEHAGAPAPSHPVNDSHFTEPTPHPARRPSRTNAANITSEVRRNGQRVHKIRHVPNDHGHDLHSQKLSNGLPLRRTYDGAMDSAIAEKFRMGATPISSRRKAAPNLPPPEQSLYSSDTATPKVPDEQPSVLPVYSHLTTEILDDLKEQVIDHGADRCRESNLVDFDPNRRFRPARHFVNRSLYYTLGDSETLLKSFRDRHSPDYMYSPLPHLDAHRLSHAFRDWGQRNGSLIFDTLYESLDALFRPPPELVAQKSPSLKPSRKAAVSPRIVSSTISPGRYLSDLEAAHIIMVCIHALTSSVHPGWPHTWVQVRKLRGWGVVIPGAIPNSASTDNFAHPWLEIIDELEYEPAIRLATRLLQAIGTRRCHEHMLATVNAQDDRLGQVRSYVGVERLLPILIGHLTQVEKAALERKGRIRSTQSTDDDPGWTVTATFMEFLRTIIVKQWDGNVEINEWSSVGTAVTLMSHFHANLKALNLRPSMFQVPYIGEEIDSIQTPLEYLKHRERPNTFHILQHPILFAQDALVGYFRAINFNRMFKQFRKTAQITNFQSRWEHLVNNPRHWNIVEDQLGVVLAEYLVLDVSRHSPLEETLDQLWGQEKRKLLKPLKVRIGILDGEVGLDQGGVTYEFFRLVLNEAFTPENGMFTVDEKTGMTWFQPASLEPLWKFEMIGVLFSLAVYNGITLPVTFPLALYDYFLHQEHNSEDIDAIDYIADGWPDLAKSFHEFLAYQGEVADIFMRDYTFSFAAFGQNIDVDMRAFRDTEWPDSAFDPSEQIPLTSSTKVPPFDHLCWRRTRDTQTEPETVTNKDRVQYVDEYVEWLTYRSVAPQLQAFTRGFHTCLHRASLNFFAPETLRSLVEGSSQSISPSLLRSQSAQYEPPFSDTHPTIKNFWSVVEQYDQDELRRLLEFVTASERVPITGYESIKFEIIWARGDTERLPTSSTCFGKLWLPEYASREKLKEKLGRAIKNSEGFGIV